MKAARITAVLAAVFGLGLAVFALRGALGPQGPAPDARFPLIDGRTLETADLRGRPVLVTFWSTTCGICIREMPHLVELYDRLGPRGLEILSVAMPYDRPDRVIAIARRKGLDYPVALDVEGRIARAFGGIRGTPTSFLIGPGGEIRFRTHGALDMGRLAEQIEQML